MQPAEQLEGARLNDGWTVLARATRKPNATGGHFSHGYIVQNHEGKKGFLKALDYSFAMTAPNAPALLHAMTQTYLFEKELCEKCSHMSRVSRAIGSGYIQVDSKDPYTRVDYLIFELAENDVRAHLDDMEYFDVAFIISCLHHVAVGLEQLHRAEIAHQDLKPSNVLIYRPQVGSKICDFGRAWDKNMNAPHDEYLIAGDRNYAPIELLYKEKPADVNSYRYGCDLYHLGNLIVFMFTRSNVTALVLGQLPFIYRPVSWGDSYTAVLPYVQTAFDDMLDNVQSYFPEIFRDELRLHVSQLCNPDLDRRGHPLDSATDRYSLHRYISRYDNMASQARVKLRLHNNA